jgi:hypothetical protein
MHFIARSSSTTLPDDKTMHSTGILTRPLTVVCTIPASRDQTGKPNRPRLRAFAPQPQ